MIKKYIFYFILLFFGFIHAGFGQQTKEVYAKFNALQQQVKATDDGDTLQSLFDTMLNLANNVDSNAVIKGRFYELKAQKGDSSQYEQGINTALRFYELGMDSVNMLRLLKEINQKHLNKKEFAKALITGQKLVQLYAYFDDNLALSTTYNQMGEVSAYLGDTIKALEYLEKSKNRIQILPDEIQFFNPWINKSNLFLNQKRLDSARKELKTPYDFYLKNDTLNANFAAALVLYAQLDLLNFNYDESEEKLKRALQIYKHNQDHYGLILVYSKLLSLYTDLDEIENADAYALLADQIISEYNVEPNFLNYEGMLFIYEHLTVYYKNMEDYEKAFLYQSAINRSLNEINSKKELQSLLQSQIETANENADMKAKMMQRKNEFNQATIERQKYTNFFAILFSISFLALTGYTYHTYLKNKNITEELSNSNNKVQEINSNLEKMVRDRTLNLLQTQKELDQFLYHASHDLRRPLTSFFGLVDLGKKNTKEQQVINVLELIESNAKDMDKLVLNLRLLSELYYVENKKEYVDVLLLLEEIKLKFKDKLEENPIEIQYSNNGPGEIFSFKSVIQAILEKTIENSIDFSFPSGGKVSIQITELPSSIEIKIKDEGQGISPLIHDKIFDMYYRGNENSKGNGLGLYIVKKAVELMDGEIEVQSELNEGAAFNITLN